MSQAIGILLIVGVIGGGVLLWMNRCNESVRFLGLCSGKSGQDILDRHNQNPGLQKWLQNAAKPGQLVDDVGPGEIASSGVMKPKNPKGPISGKGVKMNETPIKGGILALAKRQGQRVVAGYSTANLATESLSRMSYS